jgi:putative DNA primase/helicase
MHARGVDKDTIFDALFSENLKHYIPPLPDDELIKIVDSVSAYPVLEKARDLTEAGNARRFAQQHAHEIRYCHGWNKWLTWDEARWRHDDNGEAMRMAKSTAQSIYTEAAKYTDGDVRQQVAKHAMKSETAYSLEAMLRLAQSEPGISVKPSDLDNDPWILNVLNGTINLQTGKLERPSKDRLITKLAPVEFSPKAKCPEWEKFLERIMDKNHKMIRFLQRAIGYSLTGSVQEQKLFFLHGSGANGKSTFLNVIQDMLGEYAKQAAPDLLVTKFGNSHPTELAHLQGSRFVVAVEVEEGKRLAEALIKQLTGGDTITARVMYGNFFEFRPTHKLFLAANHMPIIHGTDNGIWRRIMLVPFTVTIPEKEQDKLLIFKLRDEMPGILAWAVRGCLEWQKDGLQAPSQVEKATTSYQSEMDAIGKFLNEQCVTDESSKVKVTELFEAFVRWCNENGEPSKPTRQDFSLRLKSRGFKNKRQRNGYTWIGLGLRRAGFKEDKAA